MDFINDLLTDRQKGILQYRHDGLTQQQIADIIGTSKANVCMQERKARENIIRAERCIEWIINLESQND
jgi:hypothetical protein